MDEENKNIKEAIDDLTAPKYAFNKVKGVWVTFTDGKPKVKLRKYIADKAKLLQKVNGFGYTKNRDDLKESYNIGGMAGIQKFIQEEVEMAIKKQKRLLERKNKKDEGIQK